VQTGVDRVSPALVDPAHHHGPGRLTRQRQIDRYQTLTSPLYHVMTVADMKATKR